MAGSTIAVYGAIAANVAIAVTKFAVGAITGSSAMIAEGIHSAVDTGNGALLLVGLRLSEREATPEFPFGHGKELYFWSLIVAVLIFGVGGGLSAWQGVQHVLSPPHIRDTGWNYAVLGLAALFEGSSFTIALRAFLREAGTRPFWEALHASKDPTVYTVLAEDSAALVGLALAAIGIYASTTLGIETADGAASIAIGILLAGVAILLIRESRGLLIGEGIRPDTAAEIHRLMTSHPLVRRAGRPLSMYIGPEDVLLAIDVEFDPAAPAADVATAVASLEESIRGRYPKISRIYIEARPTVPTVRPAPAQQGVHA
jgi:cation diffusion facilitator family transporter